jgi:hypothetical protein
MAGEINIYDKRSLTNAVKKIKVLEPFLLNKFFKRKKQHTAETIDFEIIKSDAKLALFANKDAPAHLIGKKSKDLKHFTIPRTYETKVWTAQELADYKALIGNIYASAAERVASANEFVADEITNLKERVYNRREEMACQILNTGKVSISQDDIEFELDFGFTTDTLDNGGHIVVLGDGYQWDDGTSKNILNDIRAAKTAMMRRVRKNVTACILGEDAAKAFINDSTIKSLLDNQNLAVGRMDLNQANQPQGTYLGKILGVEFWEYNQQYTDSSGDDQDLISANKAIFLPSDIDGELETGPIYRIDKNTGNIKIITQEFLLEPFVDNKGTILTWDLEQKSTPTIRDADNVISMTVVP